MKNKAVRLLAVVIALMLTGVSALAAPGDGVIYRNDYESGIDIYVNSMAYYDGVLYMADYGQNIYTWTRESGEMKTWPMPENVLGIDEKTEMASFRRLIPGDDGVYIMYEYSEIEDDSAEFQCMLLIKPGISGEELIFDDIEPVELDWEDMVEEYDDYSYPNDLRAPFVMGGMLVGLTYDDAYNNVIAAIDIENDDTELIPAENVASICPYKDNSVIAVSRSYESETDPVTFSAVTLDEGEFTDIFEISTTGWQVPAQLAYDGANDILYYLLNGELVRVPGLDPAAAEAVGALNVDGWNDSQPAVTEDGFLICGDYETIVVRNTDPSQRSASSIAVYTNYTSAMDKAFYDFTAANPDVEVVVLNSYEDATQAMMNQSSSVDIYTMMVAGQDYSALLDRGYMAELDSSAVISDFVRSVYPQLQRVLMREDHVVALPVEMYANSWAYNPVAFEALGLTENDVPTTWMEFIELAKRLPEIMGEDSGYTMFDPYYTAADARNMLTYGVIEDYMRYLSGGDVEFAFDTPELLALLTEIEELDYSKLGFMDEYSEEMEYAWNQEKILFFTYSNITCETYTLNDIYSRPMPLAVVEGADAGINCMLTVAFINPYSENKEAAIEYLETAVACIGASARAMLCPGYDTPVENSYYQETLDSYDETIAGIEESLAKAETDEEREQWQQQLDEFRQYRADYEANNRWNISEESIAYYRSFDHMLIPEVYTGFDNETGEEFYRLIDQYMGGKITAAELLKEIDKKIRMMMLEDM